MTHSLIREVIKNVEVNIHKYKLTFKLHHVLKTLRDIHRNVHSKDCKDFCQQKLFISLYCFLSFFKIN